MSEPVVIVGHGVAAVNAIIALRTNGYNDRIVVLSKTETLPYSPVMTSHYAGGTKTYEECFPWSEEELAALDYEVVAGATATALDPAAHTVTAQVGEEERVFAYAKCIIATGATPQTAKFPQLEGQKLMTLRTLDDAQRLAELLASPVCQGLLISGTSMVALKVTEACLERQVPVTVLGRHEHIMRKTALPSVAEAFEQSLREKGVDLRLEQVVEETEEAIAEDGTPLIRVTFSNGDVVDYSGVLVAHGVAANLDFVPEGALACEKGLMVDEFMRTSNPDIYAAGDVAQARLRQEEGSAIAGLWKDAAVQGACAGRAIAAELAGAPIPATAAYAGVLASNTLEVCGSVMISAGSVAPALNRWEEIAERNNCLAGTMYEYNQETDVSRLVGFNVFSENANPETSDAYDEGAMLYRRLIAQ